MPNIYRGKVEIICHLEVCREDKARADVTAHCGEHCECASVILIDLDETPLAEVPAARVTVKAAKKTK